MTDLDQHAAELQRPRLATESAVEVDIVRALGDWNGRLGPLYRRLADAIADAVARRQLLPGQPVPPERRLAGDLLIGRGTVIKAYDMLRADGVLESRQGSGTWVAMTGDDSARPPVLDGLKGVAPVASDVMIDMATASLEATPQLARELLTINGTDVEEMLAGTGYSHAGLARLRESIAAAYTAEGLPTQSRQILVTSGAQQAIALIARHFLAHGDTVVVEEPTSAGALDLFNESGAVVRSAQAIASAGAQHLVDAVRRSHPQLVYVQLPLGPEGEMASSGDVIDAARRLTGFAGVVVEDASLRDLSFIAPPPYLAARAVGTVLTIGSMSKLYWGGLRLGWVRGPEALIESLGRTKARADLGTSVVSQFLADRLLAHAVDIRATRVEQITANLALAGDLLRAEIPEFEWIAPDGGLAIWARLPTGTSGPFVEFARRHGVLVAPGESLSSTGVHNDRIRISLAPEPHLLREGIMRLADAWSSFTRPRRPGIDAFPDI